MCRRLEACQSLSGGINRSCPSNLLRNPFGQGASIQAFNRSHPLAIPSFGTLPSRSSIESGRRTPQGPSVEASPPSLPSKRFHRGLPSTRFQGSLPSKPSIEVFRRGLHRRLSSKPSIEAFHRSTAIEAFHQGAAIKTYHRSLPSKHFHRGLP